jgi:hypothetical protein
MIEAGKLNPQTLLKNKMVNGMIVQANYQELCGYLEQ